MLFKFILLDIRRKKTIGSSNYINKISKDTSRAGRIKTQILSYRLKYCLKEPLNPKQPTNIKGKDGQLYLQNNKITGTRPSQQLFPKEVATQLHLLN